MMRLPNFVTSGKAICARSPVSACRKCLTSRTRLWARTIASGWLRRIICTSCAMAPACSSRLRVWCGATFLPISCPRSRCSATPRPCALPTSVPGSMATPPKPICGTRLPRSRVPVWFWSKSLKLKQRDASLVSHPEADRDHASQIAGAIGIEAGGGAVAGIVGIADRARIVEGWIAAQDIADIDIDLAVAQPPIRPAQVVPEMGVEGEVGFHRIAAAHRHARAGDDYRVDGAAGPVAVGAHIACLQRGGKGIQPPLQRQARLQADGWKGGVVAGGVQHAELRSAGQAFIESQEVRRHHRGAEGPGPLAAVGIGG